MENKLTLQEYRYWLANIPNFGVRKINLLIKVFETAERIFEASEHELLQFQEICVNSGIKMRDIDINRIIISRNVKAIHESFNKLQQHGIYFVSREEEQYPEKLRNIYDAPYALYYKGRLPDKSDKLLAVVGSRNCSPYGREMAKYLAGAISTEGIGVISGLARGIDAHAHQGAIQSGGITYGILGCGIDICYPKENINLYMDIQCNGGIISEYAPGIQPFPGNFPMRNRIISGLSDGILVIEANEKSGSLITVDMGLEQGKDIYAVPGKVTDSLSKGCNNLIKMGAKLVTTPQDILEEMLPNYHLDDVNMKKNNKILESDGKIVYASLCLEPKHIEEIAIRTGLPMDRLMEQLLILELRGFIKQTMKNYYALHN